MSIQLNPVEMSLKNKGIKLYEYQMFVENNTVTIYKWIDRKRMGVWGDREPEIMKKYK